MKKLAKTLVTMSVVGSIPLVGVTSAFASTTSFSTQYQANAAKETSLLQSVQSSSDPTISQLISTVQNINSQVETLYSVEQTLANAQGSVPNVSENQSHLKNLEQQRSKVMRQWENVSSQMQRYRGKNIPKKLQLEYTQFQNQLHKINQEISSENSLVKWEKQPYDGALTELQSSILQLQTSAIYYTQEIIKLEQQGTNSTSSTQSSDTAIQDTSADNGQYVTAIQNTPGSASVTVANGTTAAELTSAIQSTDGSAQSYTVTDGDGDAVTGTLTTGDVLTVTAANGNSTSYFIIVETPTTTASSDTSIKDTSTDDGTYVISIVNTYGSESVTVPNGTTAANLTGAIQATDGSEQSYKITDPNGDILTGSAQLATGDKLTVTAADGSTTATYSITVV